VVQLELRASIDCHPSRSLMPTAAFQPVFLEAQRAIRCLYAATSGLKDKEQHIP
jgi:hypothetical protein